MVQKYLPRAFEFKKVEIVKINISPYFLLFLLLLADSPLMACEGCAQLRSPSYLFALKSILAYFVVFLGMKVHTWWLDKGASSRMVKTRETNIKGKMAMFILLLNLGFGLTFIAEILSRNLVVSFPDLDSILYESVFRFSLACFLLPILVFFPFWEKIPYPGRRNLFSGERISNLPGSWISLIYIFFAGAIAFSPGGGFLFPLFLGSAVFVWISILIYSSFHSGKNLNSSPAPGASGTSQCPACQEETDNHCPRCPQCGTPHHPECIQFIEACGICSSRKIEMKNRINTPKISGSPWFDRVILIFGITWILVFAHGIVNAAFSINSFQKVVSIILYNLLCISPVGYFFLRKYFIPFDEGPKRSPLTRFALVVFILISLGAIVNFIATTPVPPLHRVPRSVKLESCQKNTQMIQEAIDDYNRREIHPLTSFSNLDAASGGLLLAKGYLKSPIRPFQECNYHWEKLASGGFIICEYHGNPAKPLSPFPSDLMGIKLIIHPLAGVLALMTLGMAFLGAIYIPILATWDLYRSEAA